MCDTKLTHSCTGHAQQKYSEGGPAIHKTALFTIASVYRVQNEIRSTDLRHLALCTIEGHLSLILTLRPPLN